MKIVKLPKENLGQFITHLGAFGETHAPARCGDKRFAFATAADLSEISHDCTRTILPLKKYFFEPVEVTFNFSAQKDFDATAEATDKKLIVFGTHPRDNHGLKILDIVMGGRYADSHYFARRNRSVIVGLDCVPDEYCFCQSTGTDFVHILCSTSAGSKL